MHSSSLLNSVHIANRIEDRYRLRTIDETSKLWKEFLRIKQEFSPLTALDSILTEDEFVSATSGAFDKNEKISFVIEEYHPFQNVTKKLTASNEKVSAGMELAVGSGTANNRLHETRLFVSEKLLMIYNCMVRVHGRLGFLVSQGIESGRGRTWKSDPVMEEIVLGIIRQEVWEQIKGMKFAGLRALVALLEQEFVLEAKKGMRGFEEFADSVSEVNQITQAEDARARLRRDYL